MFAEKKSITLKKSLLNHWSSQKRLSALLCSHTFHSDIFFSIRLNVCSFLINLLWYSITPLSSLRQLSFFCSCFFSFYGMHFLRNPHKRYFSNWGRCHLQKSQFHQHLTRSENPGQKTRKSVYFQNWYICMLIKGQCQTWFVFSSHE